MTSRKRTPPAKRSKTNVTEDSKGVRHIKVDGGDHQVLIPGAAKKWDQLPKAVRDAMFSEAFGKRERLKRKLG